MYGAQKSGWMPGWLNQHSWYYSSRGGRSKWGLPQKCRHNMMTGRQSVLHNIPIILSKQRTRMKCTTGLFCCVCVRMAFNSLSLVALSQYFFIDKFSCEIYILVIWIKIAPGQTPVKLNCNRKEWHFCINRQETIQSHHFSCCTFRRQKEVLVICPYSAVSHGISPFAHVYS